MFKEDDEILRRSVDQLLAEKANKRVIELK